MARRKTSRHLAVAPALAALLIGLAGFAFAEKVSLTDQQISNAVDRELIKDPATPADDIAVSTANGIVTLNGRVGNIMAKERVEGIGDTVKGVRGVKGTDNNISVLYASQRSDADSLTLGARA